MRIDKLAMTSREALQTAMSTAADAQAGAVEPIHLLSALLGAGERNISVIIERIGADPAQLARSTQDAIDHAPKVSGEGQQMACPTSSSASSRRPRRRPPRWATALW